MPAKLVKKDDKLELDLAPCRGSEFLDARVKVQEMDQRDFDWDRKIWVLPATADNAEQILKRIRPEAPDSLHNWVREARTTEAEELTTPLPKDAELQISWATARQPWQPEEVNEEKFDGLFDWQRAAVDAMASRNRALLADDMGLGKTLQAISAVEEWRLRNGNPEGPRLVVAPNSVKGSWARELDRWLDNAPVAIINGSTPARRTKQLEESISDNAWGIVNWEQLRVKRERRTLKSGAKRTVKVMKEPLFQETEWLAVIADEVHRAKNRKSQQAQGLWRVRGKVMFGLSGTPLMNSPDELWSILRWLWPDEYHESGRNHNPNAIAYWPFYESYCEFWEDTYGRKVITGVKHPDALRYELSKKLIRRTAAILKLKGRRRIYYPVELNKAQQRLYDTAEKEMWLAVEKAMQEGDESAKKFAKAAAEGESIGSLYRIPNGASRLVRLQQILESPALLGGEDDSALMDDCVEKVEDSRPDQWVVACKFKESCNLLTKRLEAAGVSVGLYTGDVDPQDRTALENKFQRGEVEVIVGTLAALKEGITLTAAHMMYQMTRDFVPDVNEQFESRCDRLGQQEQVRVFIPQAEGTVATGKVEPINRLKENIVKTVVPKDEIKETRRARR